MLKSEGETPKKKTTRKSPASGSEPKTTRNPSRGRKKAASAETPGSVETPIQHASPEPAPAAPSHEEIARRAYELYLSRGRGNGAAAEDWLQAERELRGDRRKPGNA